MKLWVLAALGLLMMRPLEESPNRADIVDKVLIFYGTCGFRHPSIDSGLNKLKIYLESQQIANETTNDANYFDSERLKSFSAIVFLQTVDSADCLLSGSQKKAVEQFVYDGGGFVAIHGAADAGYKWPWYGYLVGAYFNGHPPVQRATIRKLGKHLSVDHLPDTSKWTDEWYNFTFIDTTIIPVLAVDEETYKGGIHGSSHPIAWHHRVGNGKSFFTALGHLPSNYSDSLFLRHLAGGIRSVLRRRVAADNDGRVFVKSPLTQPGQLEEPTEMSFLPNGDVIIAERKGKIKYYNRKKNVLSTAGVLNVFTDAELGLMGLQTDPDVNLPYVYIYYSPKESNVNRLSRFTILNSKLDLGSEKIILTVYVDRQWCCHTGGSIAFGKNRELYLATGDNSTPFNPFNEKVKSKFVDNGFPPMDERQGYEGYNALRSSANSNDLRGKILRITIRNDGSYGIPQDNLFPIGDTLGRSEIYAMGCRNPYRITVYTTSNYLFWGDIGPDAAHDSIPRGPKGYDELNRTTQAGNFGWPMFIGENWAYRSYNYQSGQSGNHFAKERPENLSRHNTGHKILPQAQPAWLSYPYGKSNLYPELGSGARSLMVGPVFKFKTSFADSALPVWLNNRLLIYDWSRNWLDAVPTYLLGRCVIEPVFGKLNLASPIDMAIGPDGCLYVLEYGTGAYTKNTDARLSRITYVKQKKVVQQPLNKSPSSAKKTPLGEQLFKANDCRTCHKFDDASLGPSILQIRKRYNANAHALTALAMKVKNGGSGSWGKHTMPAHPEMSEADVKAIISWILNQR